MFFSFVEEAYAQTVNEPLSWVSKVIIIKKNLYEIQFIGSFEENCEGCYIYDLFPYNNGLTPTSLIIKSNPAAKLIGEPYILTKINKTFNEAFDMEIGTCKDSIVVARKVLIITPHSVVLTAIIKWQVCDGHSCFQPSTKEFLIRLPHTN